MFEKKICHFHWHIVTTRNEWENSALRVDRVWILDSAIFLKVWWPIKLCSLLRCKDLTLSTMWVLIINSNFATAEPTLKCKNNPQKRKCFEKKDCFTQDMNLAPQKILYLDLPTYHLTKKTRYTKSSMNLSSVWSRLCWWSTLTW